MLEMEKIMCESDGRGGERAKSQTRTRTRTERDSSGEEEEEEDVIRKVPGSVK